MREFLDTLIPGDADFPSASAVGLHEALLAHDRFSGPYEALSRHLPGGFGHLSPQRRAEAVAEMEAAQPALFNALIVGVYSLYYTRPAVAAVIEAQTGHTARPPQPGGHFLPPFDPALVAIPAARPPQYRPTPEAGDA